MTMSVLSRANRGAAAKSSTKINPSAGDLKMFPTVILFSLCRVLRFPNWLLAYLKAYRLAVDRWFPKRTLESEPKPGVRTHISWVITYAQEERPSDNPKA